MRSCLTSWAVLACLALGLSTGPAKADLVIGGFDAKRAGDYSLRDGRLMTNLRGAIGKAFPGAKLTATDTLTPEYLAGVDVVFLSAVLYDLGGKIRPLSPDEQAALVDFVLAGGTALIFADNTDFQGASDSLLRPFGLHSTGFFPGRQRATVIDPPAHPVTEGPFGLIGETGSWYPGYFDVLPEYAVPLAALDVNGEPFLAVIPAGALAETSGGVVFLSDYAVVDDHYDIDPNLILNALAFLDS